MRQCSVLPFSPILSLWEDYFQKWLCCWWMIFSQYVNVLAALRRRRKLLITSDIRFQQVGITKSMKTSLLCCMTAGFYCSNRKFHWYEINMLTSLVRNTPGPALTVCWQSIIHAALLNFTLFWSNSPPQTTVKALISMSILRLPTLAVCKSIMTF